MDKIVPNLWYDKEAGEAAEFYALAFGKSAVKGRKKLADTPGGDAEIVEAEFRGSEFILLSAGPFFKFNPSISFLVPCGSAGEVDRLHGKLGIPGSELMPLGSYPFAERYVWLIDRYGVSWQFIHRAGFGDHGKIVPTLMFTGPVYGRAEEAVGYYSTIFANSHAGEVVRYGSGAEPDAADAVKHLSFSLEGRNFAVMDSAHGRGFSFNEAVSFMVKCDAQDEIDYYWDTLSAVPEAEQCGWLKDRFGVSWQIVPRELERLMREAPPDKAKKVTEVMFGMKRLDIAVLRKAAR